jgi:hypothetical protein
MPSCLHGSLRVSFESLRHVYAVVVRVIPLSEKQALIYAIIRYLDPTAGEHNE